MGNEALPPHIAKGDRVILFDGICKLCSRWANFIIAHDKQHHFKLCSVQSVEGQAILDHFGYPVSYYKTMLYIEEGVCYEKSDAFLRIIKLIGFPWSMLSTFKLVPRPTRDWLYDKIALNRYKIFGQHPYCWLPSVDHSKRFIDE